MFVEENDDLTKELKLWAEGGDFSPFFPLKKECKEDS